MEMLDPTADGQVDKVALAASQVDWRDLQERDGERFRRMAQRSFYDLDADLDGVLKPVDIRKVNAASFLCSFR